jgi:hypothetical protein
MSQSGQKRPHEAIGVESALPAIAAKLLHYGKLHDGTERRISN